MATVIEQDVLEALKGVTDPDRRTDIVSLGMVAGLVVKDGNVGFSLEVDPARGEALEPLRQAAEAAVFALDGVSSVTAVLTAHSAGGESAAPATPPRGDTGGAGGTRPDSAGGGDIGGGGAGGRVRLLGMRVEDTGTIDVSGGMGGSPGAVGTVFRGMMPVDVDGDGQLDVVFAGFAFVVLLGTIFPLIVEAIDGRTISVGNPYFDQMTMPIGFTLLFLMAVAPILPWRKASGDVLSDRLIWPAWLGVGSMVFAAVVGARGWAPMLAFGLGGFAGGAALRQVVLATRRQGWRGLVGRTNGGMIVHLGVVLIAVAFAASNAYVRQGEFTLEPGDSAVISGHTLTYEGSRIVEYSNRVERKADIRVDGGQVYAPAISTYPFAGQTIGTPSVRSTLQDDIALSVLSFPEDVDDAVVLRATVQPLILWLWIGGIVMAVGTALAVVPGRRRNPIAPTSALIPEPDSVEAPS